MHRGIYAENDTGSQSWLLSNGLKMIAGVNVVEDHILPIVVVMIYLVFVKPVPGHTELQFIHS